VIHDDSTNNCLGSYSSSTAPNSYYLGLRLSRDGIEIVYVPISSNPETGTIAS